jgi:hypothetical protein
MSSVLKLQSIGLVVSFKELVFIFAICLVLVIFHRRSSIPNQLGGDRKAIFSRFHYMPDLTFMSTFDMDDPDRFSKRYNIPGPLKLIKQRPYRFYEMPPGNWGYPWHFPRPTNHKCLDLASKLCEEKIDMNKNLIRPSECYDSVYKQCQLGIDPLLIKVSNKNVYEYIPPWVGE